MKDVYLLKDNANLWHQQFTYIENGASHCYLGWTPVFSPLITFGPSKYTNCVLDMSIPQSDNTFLVLSIIASDQNKMTLKIKTKWLWIFVKINYIYSDNFFPCSRGHFICKQNNILSMTSTFNYEFFEVGIQK